MKNYFKSFAYSGLFVKCIAWVGICLFVVVLGLLLDLLIKSL